MFSIAKDGVKATPSAKAKFLNPERICGAIRLPQLGKPSSSQALGPLVSGFGAYLRSGYWVVLPKSQSLVSQFA